MGYKTVRQTVQAIASTQPLQVLAEDEYKNRLSGWSTFRSGFFIKEHEVFVVMFRKLSLLLDKIHEQENKVVALWSSLPPTARRAYIFDLIGEEIFSSNTIEGVRSTRKEISEALSANINKQRSRRFSEFTRLFLTLTEEENKLSTPSSLEDIRNIYDRVVAGELEAEDEIDGELFRANPVYIDNPGRRGHIHVGVTPESNIKVMLTQWLNLTQSKNIPPLVRAALCHFIFEHIHPFYDGNGRTGRFLFALHLSEHLSAPTVISISPMISEGKKQYYKAFEEVQHPLNCCDASTFVYSMMDFVHKAQRHLIDDLLEKQQALNIVNNTCEKLCEKYGYSTTISGVIFTLAQEELFGDSFSRITRQNIAHELNLGYNSVSRALEKLEADGFATHQGSKPAYYSLTLEARKLLGIN